MPETPKPDYEGRWDYTPLEMYGAFWNGFSEGAKWVVARLNEYDGIVVEWEGNKLIIRDVAELVAATKGDE